MKKVKIHATPHVPSLFHIEIQWIPDQPQEHFAAEVEVLHGMLTQGLVEFKAECLETGATAVGHDPQAALVGLAKFLEGK